MTYIEPDTPDGVPEIEPPATPKPDIEPGRTPEELPPLCGGVLRNQIHICCHANAVGQP